MNLLDSGSTSRTGKSKHLAICPMTWLLTWDAYSSVFRHFDSDNSGTIEANELANALRQFGYNLSPQLINLVATKYCESHECLIMTTDSMDVCCA